VPPPPPPANCIVLMNFNREGCTRKNVTANWDLGTEPLRLFGQHRKPIKFVCMLGGGGGGEMAPGDYNGGDLL
jgi:hypothetical protein